MTIEAIYIPFPKALYDDIVRFSSGKLDPADLAEDQVRSLFLRNMDDLMFEWFGNNLLPFVRRHFPEAEKEITKAKPNLQMGHPLRWKQIVIPHGSKVRMAYRGEYHTALVQSGKIEDRDGQFSPSEWARKIANNTSRNAWNDIEFKDIRSGEWNLAADLRKRLTN